MAFDNTDDLVQHINAQHEKVVGIVKGEFGKAQADISDLKAEFAEVQQKLARRGGGGGELTLSLGAEVVASAEYADFLRDNLRGRRRLDVKASITSAAGSAGALIQPDRREAFTLPQQVLTVRDLVAPGRTKSNLVELPRQTVRTNNADVVTEGTLKPESAIEFELEQAKVVTIAHWVKVSKQAMADGAQLASIIDSELIYGVQLAEEHQLLNGTGVGEQLEGLVTAATAFSPPFTISGATELDVLRQALAQVSAAKLTPDGVVMHPNDWAVLQTLKDSEGRYIGGGPFGATAPTVWGVPVVTSFSMTQGHYLTGAFRQSAQIFDREEVSVLISDEDGDNFVKNMLTVLCEERLAFAVKRPSGLVYGTL